MEPVAGNLVQGPMRRLLLTLGFALSLCAGALAQPAGLNIINGNECWVSGTGGPPVPSGVGNGVVCATQMRGGTPTVVLTAVAGNFTVGAATNTTTASGSNAANVALGGTVIITAQPSAAVITMPPNPLPDGTVVKVCNGTAATAFSTNAVTVGANSSQTMVPTGANITLTTLAASTCVAFQFALANTSWYKVQ